MCMSPFIVFDKQIEIIAVTTRRLLLLIFNPLKSMNK